ncbi:MAG: hypothetical protein ABI318_08865 [Chthoniobacteraceae bacterium]
MMRLVFISHVFPDAQDAWRGLENVALLHALSDRWDIRAVALRPVGAFSRSHGWHPRAADVKFRPEFAAVPTLSILGAGWNVRRAARALRKPLTRLRRDWHFDAVLAAPLLPGTCAVARLANEFQFRFVALSVQDEAAQQLGGGAAPKIIASALTRAAGVVTDSTALSALLSKTGFRKDRMTFISSQESAAEACHRLLLPTRD